MDHHCCTHCQVSNGEIHNPVTAGPKFDHKGFRQSIHESAVASQTDYKKAPRSIATCNELPYTIGDHLITNFFVIPLLEPSSSDLHCLLKTGRLY